VSCSVTIGWLTTVTLDLGTLEQSKEGQNTIYVRVTILTLGLKTFRILLLAGLLMMLALQIHPVGAQSCGPNPSTYYVASMNGDIDPGSADFMATTVSNAQAQCAGHLVFILTTNGGDGASMENMIGSISSYQAWGGNFTTLVAPQGSYAFSAGSYIAEASNQIFMTPGTTIGSATPIVSGIPTGEENSTMRKDINAFASYMSTLTLDNHRNGTATSLMVTEGKSFDALCPTSLSASGTCLSALKEHVINGVINSTTVQGALTFLSVPQSTPINTPSFRSQLISVLSDPNVSSLLFLLGVFCILADIYHPTLILSIVGAAVIATALFGLGVFGAAPLAVVLMIIGAGFIFLEVKTQHGISALVGVVIFIIGFLLVFQLPPAAAPSGQGPPPPSTGALFSGIPDITYGLLVALGAAIVIASIYLRSIRDALRRRPRVNEPTMVIGKQGKMESDLAAGGKGVAMVSSEEWTVTSTQPLRRGDLIVVKAVIGQTLSVEKVEGQV
jgi:membrane-bound serine protease (ClpP class)